MRKRIRLTGRKQLAKSCVDAQVVALGDKKVVSLGIAEPKIFQAFPRDARIKLRLFENKVAETLEFGTLGKPRATTELRNRAFVAPSCQFRVVSCEEQTKGLLLGSTDTWTLRDANQEDGSAVQGILRFQPADIAPRIWKLDARGDEYPIVYVDKQIPDARSWVRNDPTFVGTVLPAIISQVFDEILDHGSPSDVPWMKDWLEWADLIMPGSRPPNSGDHQEKREWVDRLLDGFSNKHGLHVRLVKHLRGRNEQP
jgi:hypothetical protein